jgi:hypothetical protein
MLGAFEVALRSLTDEGFTRSHWSFESFGEAVDTGRKDVDRASGKEVYCTIRTLVAATIGTGRPK